MEKKALGKGLDALLPSAGGRSVGSTGADVQLINVEQIIPNRYQPRQIFSESALHELVQSIKLNGILQPVLVRRTGDGVFELIAGERRFRAAKLVGLRTVPAIVRTSNDEQAMEIALIENLQRQDLNPMEAARAYNRLIKEFGLTQDVVAQKVAKDRSSVANIVRLINLPSKIQQLVERGEISTGHAKVLLGLTSQEAQLDVAQRIVDNQLSVRQAERLATSHIRAAKSKKMRANPHMADLEEKLRRKLGTKVSVASEGTGGKIVVHYFSGEELNRLIEILLS